MCFANAGIQTILAVRPLAEALLLAPDNVSSKEESAESTNQQYPSTTEALHRFMGRYNRLNWLLPSEIHGLCPILGLQEGQNDIGEFTMNLLGRLREETANSGRLVLNKVAHLDFMTEIVITITCPVCVHSTEKNGVIFNLGLTIGETPSTLRELVRSYFDDDIVEAHAKYPCEGCELYEHKEKKTRAVKYAETLLITVNRNRVSTSYNLREVEPPRDRSLNYEQADDPMEDERTLDLLSQLSSKGTICHDEAKKLVNVAADIERLVEAGVIERTFSTTKINTELWAESTLDLAEWSVTKEEAIFDLAAIACHTGTPQSGHYYAYVKVNEQWWLADDRIVRRAEWNEVSNQKNGTMFIFRRK